MRFSSKTMKYLINKIIWATLCSLTNRFMYCSSDWISVKFISYCIFIYYNYVWQNFRDLLSAVRNNIHSQIIALIISKNIILAHLIRDRQITVVSMQSKCWSESLKRSLGKLTLRNDSIKMRSSEPGTFGYGKRHGIFWLTERLLFSKGLCSMEVVECDTFIVR